jgi:hypothetical protein
VRGRARIPRSRVASEWSEENSSPKHTALAVSAGGVCLCRLCLSGRQAFDMIPFDPCTQAVPATPHTSPPPSPHSSRRSRCPPPTWPSGKMTNRWPEPITQVFINNEFVDTLTSAEIASINPVDESTLGVFQAATEADVNVAVAAAKAAFAPGSEYRTMTGAQRRDMMVRLADIIEAHGEELCRWESLDVGKPITQCRQDLAGVIGSWRYYAGWADKITGSVTENTGDNNMFTYSTREPVGVCGQIIPWNFPMMMQAWKLAPAVCTGCTIVMKSSEKTPVTALMMMDLVREAGFPAGVINLLTGDGACCVPPSLLVHRRTSRYVPRQASTAAHTLRRTRTWTRWPSPAPPSWASRS